MKSEIQIHCDDGFARGQKKQIEIVVNFDSPTKVRGIRAIFLGRETTKADYTVTEQDSKGRSKTVTRTAVEHVEIVKESFKS